MWKGFCSKTILQQHTEMCAEERYLYVNIVRNQSQEAEFLESNLKRFKLLSKYAGHQKTLTVKFTCINRVCTCNELFKYTTALLYRLGAVNIFFSTSVN